jgi:hypothetical protein
VTVHDSAYEVAGNDARIAKMLRATLTRMAEGPDGSLKEMAVGVLSGKIDLRQAAMSDAYGAELGRAFGTFWTHYQELDDDERRELTEKGQQQLDALLDG